MLRLQVFPSLVNIYLLQCTLLAEYHKNITKKNIIWFYWQSWVLVTHNLGVLSQSWILSRGYIFLSNKSPHNQFLSEIWLYKLIHFWHRYMLPVLITQTLGIQTFLTIGWSEDMIELIYGVAPKNCSSSRHPLFLNTLKF